MCDCRQVLIVCARLGAPGIRVRPSAWYFGPCKASGERKREGVRSDDRGTIYAYGSPRDFWISWDCENGQATLMFLEELCLESCQARYRTQRPQEPRSSPTKGGSRARLHSPRTSQT